MCCNVVAESASPSSFNFNFFLSFTKSSWIFLCKEKTVYSNVKCKFSEFLIVILIRSHPPICMSISHIHAVFKLSAKFHRQNGFSRFEHTFASLFGSRQLSSWPQTISIEHSMVETSSRSSIQSVLTKKHLMWRRVRFVAETWIKST